MSVHELPRREQLAAALGGVRGRIGRACEVAGRDPASVTLIAVTKTYPADDVVMLARLGVTDMGENRDQEAASKAAEVAAGLDGGAGGGVRWHYVGRLQRNKCRSVVGYADVVHSVDSMRLAAALDDASQRHRAEPVDVLVQVSIDGDPSRGGAVDSAADPEVELWRVADAVAGAPGLRLTGLMAVAPRDWEAERAFAVLAAYSARLQVRHPAATAVSAGMSGDLEAAVAYGATHVRIGSALLGMRNTLR